MSVCTCRYALVIGISDRSPADMVYLVLTYPSPFMKKSPIVRDVLSRVKYIHIMICYRIPPAPSLGAFYGSVAKIRIEGRTLFANNSASERGGEAYGDVAGILKRGSDISYLGLDDLTSKWYLVDEANSRSLL